MFETLKNAWKLPDLKRRICFTLMIIVIFRFGAALPVPFLDASVMQGFGDGNLLGFLNMLTGGAFQNATLFALSISPYITASIVVQLLAVAIPALEQMAKEGAEGRKRLNKISRYVTIGLALIQSFGYYQLLNRRGAVVDGGNAFGNFLLATTIILMFTAGSMICVWLGEQIDEKGIGNGISMILFAGIVSRGPSVVLTMWQYLVLGYQGLKAGSTGTGLRYMIGIPVLVVIFVIIYIILKYTRLGRAIYTVGGNTEVARLAGMKPDAIILICYTFCGILAGLAGTILVGKLSSASTVAAQGYELDLITAVALGGTSMEGGKGGIIGTLIGTAFLAVMNTGMDMVNIPSFYQYLIKGMILVFAVYMDTFFQKHRKSN